jgi:hypothetical protein
MTSKPQPDGRLHCSFCNKSHDDVESVNLIADDDRIRAVSGKRVVDRSIPWPGSAPIILCPLRRMLLAVTAGVKIGRRGLLCPARFRQARPASGNLSAARIGAHPCDYFPWASHSEGSAPARHEREARAA